MAKQITAISINNRVFSINTFHVEAVALQYFNTSFLEADSKLKANIKSHIRNLVKGKPHLSAQIIEDTIFYSFLTKKLQKDIESLAYLKGL